MTPRCPILVVQAILKVVPEGTAAHLALSKNLDTLQDLRGIMQLDPKHADMMSWGFLTTALEAIVPLDDALIEKEPWRLTVMKIFNAELDYREYLL